MSEHICPTCGVKRLHRSGRRTFMEQYVYPIFGRYPWICKSCRKRLQLKDRGNRRRTKSNESGEERGAATST